MVQYRELCFEEVRQELFSNFQRKQNVTQCWRKIDGEWLIKDVFFVDDWTEQEHVELIDCLRKTILTNGLVIGAFLDGRLKGFASVESTFSGKYRQYMDLSSIHVSQDMRRKGIGKELFRIAKEYAKKQGAQKLYISAHSAVESQAFYRAMGCVEAEEYNAEHVKKEPCDCQLECRL